MRRHQKEQAERERLRLENERRREREEEEALEKARYKNYSITLMLTYSKNILASNVRI